MAPPSTRAALAALLLSAALVSLSACAPDRSPIPLVTESASPSPIASPTASPSASAEDVGTPVTIACEALITPQAMYDYNPNFGASTSFTPKAGSTAATIVGYHGKSCSWVNQTSGDTITVSVANLPSSKLAEIQSGLQSTSTSTAAFGSTGFFAVAGGVGTADAFSGAFWVSVSSVEFIGASDAQPIVSDVLGALPH